MAKFLITHYGLYWSKDAVFWGTGGKRGQMLGKEAGRSKIKGCKAVKCELEKCEVEGCNTEGGEVEGCKVVDDFRDYKGIYALYDEKGALIYIGVAIKQKLFYRLNQHRNNKDWEWQKFSWFGCKQIYGQITHRDTMEQVEAMCIVLSKSLKHETAHNKTRGSFAPAIKVVQIRHPNAK